MEKIVKLYKTLSQTPSLSGAKFINENVINTFWSQRNIETGKNVKFMRTHFLDKNNNKYVESFPTDISQINLMAISPKGKKRAVLRESPNGKEGRKQFIEIWTNDYLSHSVDLSALNLHGDVYTDGDFRSWLWSPDESKIAYIAEKKPPKSEPFYKRKSDTPENNGEPKPTIGTEYTYKQDWGENLVGKYFSVIAVYDLNEDKVKVLKGIPKNYCPAHITWSLDGSSIVGTALDSEPRKLGLVYCSNRSAVLFRIDFNEHFVLLNTEDVAVSHPQFSPDGNFLIWIERETNGPHQTCLKLMKMDFSKQALPEVVIDIVKYESMTSNEQTFHGLYNVKIPERCWASKNRVILSTNQKYTIKTYVICIETNKITELQYEDGSQTVLDVFNDNVLVSRDNYLQTSQCLTAVLPGNGCEDQIKWKEVTELKKIELLQDMKYEFMDLYHENCDEINYFSAIYYGPKCGDEASVPIIVWPHGGPHSAFWATFVLEPSIYVSLGFAIIFVNYRGSIGHGNATINYLLDRVGSADVQDCIKAVDISCKKFPWLDNKKIALVGGSHGGFLVHHLSGQYPDMFKVVVSRNPVVDIASMQLSSDIPDWCAVESGFDFSQLGPVNNDLLVRMRDLSPIQYAHQIQAPTFLMLGSKDLRVPCSQGLELMHRLKSHGVPVKVNMYDDNHPLASLPNEMDHIINGALWILEHITDE